MPVEKRTPIPVSEAIKRIVNENIIMDITNVNYLKA